MFTKRNNLIAFFVAISITALVLLSTVTTNSHPGRTDRSGCHNDRSSGGRHCHGGGGGGGSGYIDHERREKIKEKRLQAKEKKVQHKAARSVAALLRAGGKELQFEFAAAHKQAKIAHQRHKKTLSIAKSKAKRQSTQQAKQMNRTATALTRQLKPK